MNRRIHILRDDVARKIAAGEVIDRPFSVVRELLDNSIDAGARDVEVRIKDGGIEEIRVIDDGIGMSKEDLEVCYLSHATSKIEELGDIYQTKTLGFRGEALSSIATCSRLEIISKRQNMDYAYRLIVEGGKFIELRESPGVNGTTVSVSKLFYNMPARRAFLKSKSAENFMCKSIFLEKSLPFPEISFRFFSNEKLNIFLPGSGLFERVFTAYSDLLVKDLLIYDEYEEDAIKIRMVAGDPSLVRKDRKLIQIFVNGRRINEYSLIKVVEYGFSGYVPGGYFPVCFLFIDINPELVDFNVHPAKKEVKFKNISPLKASVIEIISRNMRKLRVRVRGMEYTEEGVNPDSKISELGLVEKPKRDTGILFGVGKGRRVFSSGNSFLEVAAGKTVEESADKNLYGGEIIYLGQIFGLFLVGVYNDTLLVVDQHAAHERIVFDELMKKPLVAQDLLFPIYFRIEDENLLTTERIKFLESLGVKINKVGPLEYEIAALPEDFLVLEENELIDFIKEVKGDVIALKREIFDSVACKMAIKEGEVLDEITALSLLKKAVSLEDARCPHGRPIWFSISKSELLKFVKRL